MIVVTQSAINQMQSMISQFGTYKTRGEYGRSAFWIWYDKIQNEIKSVNIKHAKKVGEASYRFHMQYWGDIIFDVLYIRNKGKFAGNQILITGFKFDEDNLYNWLQHIAPIEHRESLPNIPDTRTKPKPLGFGFTRIKAKSGLFTVADANGKPITNEWFKNVAKMHKTGKSEIATVVNKDGWAYAFYPQRETERQLEKMGKSWGSVVAESAFNKAFKEAINKICTGKQLNEAFYEPIEIDEDDIRRLIRHTLKRQYELLESIYKPIGYDGMVTLDSRPC